MIVNGSTTSVMLPTDMFEGDTALIRVVAFKRDVNNNALATAISKFMIVYPGVKGLFNVEIGDVGPFEYHTFQVDLSGPLYGDLVKCSIIE
jgi:hypothetical protein